MKNLLFLFFVFVFLFPLVILAQDLVPVSADQVVTAAGRVIDDWQTLGWIGGAIAAVGFIMTILRFPLIDTWLERYNLKRFKPLASAVLGGATGMLSTLATGASLPQSLLAGIAAGFAATGVHQAIVQPVDNAMPTPPKDKLPKLA